MKLTKVLTLQKNSVSEIKKIKAQISLELVSLISKLLRGGKNESNDLI